MRISQNNFLKNYGSILLLLVGLIIGSVLGVVLGDKVEIIKPLGDIFINLLFTVVVPLVFFAISSAIANVERGENFGKLIIVMFLVFIGTELLAATITLIAARWFPIHAELGGKKVVLDNIEKKTIGDQITQLLTANDFFELLSRKSMLALIIFSILTGFGVLLSGEKGKAFKDFLNSGNEVLKKLLIIIMKIAPLGLGAYFAVQIGTIGPQLFGTYRDAMVLYHGVCLVYFAAFFSLYAFLAGGFKAVKLYWRNNIVPSATAIGTCSSIATIPANLDGTAKMGVPQHIRNIVVPLGATLHKDGSSISSIVKIAVVFTMFGRSLNSADAVLLALGITVIVSMVEGGVPNGAYIGELLMISVYGFPQEALPPAMIIGTLVDPLATVLNATGDNVCAMMVTRFAREKTKAA